MPNVTVVGATGAIVTVPFTGSANYALAQHLAALINTAAPASLYAGGTGTLNATNAPATPSGSGVTEEVTSIGGALSVAPGTNFLTDNAAGAVTVQGTPFLNVLAGTGGLTFFGASAGNGSIAVGGGDNVISLPNGSQYYAALGTGSDTVFAGGNGTVDASAGGGSNLIFVSPIANTHNVVYSAGTRDTIIAGAGHATIGESGSGATIYLGSGSAVVADGGTADTVIGGPGTGVATLFGGSGEMVWGDGKTLDFIAGVNNASTVAGGVADTVFGAAGSDVTYLSGPTGATLSAGAGNETLNAAGSTQNDMLVGGSGTTTFTVGTGADTVAFFDGRAGGTDIVSGFTSKDTLLDSGYGAAAPTVSASGGNTMVTLGDGTKVTLTDFSGNNFLKSV
jgi:hypothetical protein